MSGFQRPTLFLLPAILVLTGCRQQGGTPSKSEEAVSKPPSVSQEVPGYSTDELGSIGAYLPVQDAGRVELAPPAGWHAASRSRDYVARFIFDRNRRLALPRITVEVDEAAAEDPRNLTKANVAAYCSSIQENMDEKQRRALDSKIEPLMLGHLPCARYVVKKKFSQGERLIQAEREVLQTVRGGRVYTLLLDAHLGTLMDYRAEFYTVAAWMKFPLAAVQDESESEKEADSAEADSAKVESNEAESEKVESK